MNYLAHAYLSFKDPDILTGNMISDYVKGRKKFNYTEKVQKGIMLHRLIDEYTDNHIVCREIQKIFKPAYGLYSGPIVDVIMDYFVARDKALYLPSDLMTFSEEVFSMLEDYTTIFPEKFARMFPYMKSQNWLYNYQFPEGIWNSLGGLARRAKYINETNTAYELFIAHEDEIQHGYNEFFPQLKAIAYQAFKSEDKEI
jgi:acyl carrier protein phosphodiesterase